jgi:hypothetical protein
LDEFRADDPPLLLRVGDSAQFRQKLCACVDSVNTYVKPGCKSHYLSGLIGPHQSMVNQDADQAVADGAVDKRRGDHRIDASAQAANHPLLADAVPHVTYPSLYKGGWSPIRLAFADVE